MSACLNWIISNYKFLLVCLAVLVVIFLCVLVLIKVSSKNLKVLLGLFTKLPDFINSCEEKGFSKSEDKLNYVLQLALNYLIITTGCSVKKAVSQYSEILRQHIEDILSTPQKKEGVVDAK